MKRPDLKTLSGSESNPGNEAGAGRGEKKTTYTKKTRKTHKRNSFTFMRIN